MHAMPRLRWMPFLGGDPRNVLAGVHLPLPLRAGRGSRCAIAGEPRRVISANASEDAPGSKADYAMQARRGATDTVARSARCTLLERMMHAA
eukprot:4718505-Pleurochrysis_carterae.AAC.1